MKSTVFFLTLGATVLALSCSSINVSHDYDPQANFNNLKTFSWLSFPKKAKVNQLVVKRIQDAVTGELEAKGLRLSSNPDFMIAMHGATKEKLDIQDWGYSSPRAAYWGQRDITVQQYTEGTLILDFVDAKSKEIIWRGVASGAVDPGASPEKRTKRINEGVAKLLAKFPPVPST